VINNSKLKGKKSAGEGFEPQFTGTTRIDRQQLAPVILDTLKDSFLQLLIGGILPEVALLFRIICF